ncbi:alpha/beta hydrolase [Rhizobium sp. P44RR-XXIV]|uniref:alpha/beta hydrolase n=1 Tax=Rhizobium sp. P44RR-XXIV TaxID=1921145 RepID=UPI0009873B9F|nr:alpha/beta hydrolase [Rhizobium sp. P44RR-XXIV]TIX88056.1 alpha/beta hydrolase [Rhizobium sp. P44RR-XXIV]
MMDRRSFLIATAFATLSTTVRAASSNSMIQLWPGQPPGGGGPTGPVQRNDKGAVSNIAAPGLEVFAPEKPNGASMLIAAGGGYKRIELGNEAYPAARWLASKGITAYVLTYRLPREGWENWPLAPLQDAQRAMRVIRAEAARRQLDSSRVGVLGFSAGGHLLGLAATRSAFASYQANDAIDGQSARPNLASLIYPVITLKPPYDHTSTRRSLIGSHPDAEASAEWSVETHVRSGCPPVFLAQAEDDPISDPANTLIMADACRKAGIPVELHRLPSGGHGFGMGKPGTPTADWPGWWEQWLRGNHFL